MPTKNIFILSLIFQTAITFTLQNVIANETIEISHFASQSLEGWQVKNFKGKTLYQLKKDPLSKNDSYVLHAKANAGASGFFHEVSINLNKTPYFNWSWLVNDLLTGIKERTKDGDDFTARIYVGREHPYFFWKTEVLNYVWSSNQAKQLQWSNPYTAQAQMLSLRGHKTPTGQWYTEKRNIKEDFKAFFGTDADSVNMIAIMTDTDNSKLSAEAYYGEVYFSEK